MYPIVDLVEHQTIAAVEHVDNIERAIQSPANIVFLLSGSIYNVKDLVNQLQSMKKHVFIHMEFVEGIAADRCGISYIAEIIKPTGIISTKSNVIRTAREAGMMAIQRIFLIDRNAVERGIKTAEQCRPDAIEVMPGIMPRVIREMTDMTNLPIISGGLIAHRQEIDEALVAGALAVSVGTPELW